MANIIDENNVLGDEQLDSVTGGYDALSQEKVYCWYCGYEMWYDPLSIPFDPSDPNSLLHPKCPKCGGYMVKSPLGAFPGTP